MLGTSDSWAFAGAVLAGGALATALGGRAAFALLGAALLRLFAAYVSEAPRRRPATGDGLRRSRLEADAVHEALVMPWARG